MKLLNIALIISISFWVVFYDDVVRTNKKVLENSHFYSALD